MAVMTSFEGFYDMAGDVVGVVEIGASSRHQI
jgi:hypothetical protein